MFIDLLELASAAGWFCVDLFKDVGLGRMREGWEWEDAMRWVKELSTGRETGKAA